MDAVVTCEHGGNRIPDRYAEHFRSHGPVLESHRGFDRGALVVARYLARTLDAPLFGATISRLLVDLNRSIHNRRLFSEFVEGIDPEGRRRILERYYLPYRREVEERIASRVHRGDVVLHLSVHSFTPVLGGRKRKADVGLLYDPRRAGEFRFARALQSRLQTDSFKVRRNHPYRGSADGFTTYLRSVFPESRYRGIEIELNQGTFQTRVALLGAAQALGRAIQESVPA
jgi:predicted N-formylglutamate amidohydrolase